MSNSLIKLDELTKPATVLIEKISDAVGGIFKPYQMVRIAKAEAEADQIRAQSQIHVTDLHRRAMHRFLEEEAKKQSNIEEITRQSLPLLNSDSSPDRISDDWITNFFDKSRIISDSDMQKLWAKILAQEANAPGGFSRRTINLLSDLEKRDAELFSTLCCFSWDIGIVVPLVYDLQNPIYTSRGITFHSLAHLNSLGLIQFDALAGFKVNDLPKNVRLSYFGRSLQIELLNLTENYLELGKVFLTQAGQELARICDAKPIDGVVEYIRDRWTTRPEHTVISVRET